MLGGTDAGKTHTAHRLFEHAGTIGMSAALLDADPGQADIGLPFCVGLTTNSDHKTADHTAAAMAFVGGVSPANYITEKMVAIRRMVDLAHDCHAIIIDMAGYINGVGARRLHQLTAEMLSPRHVLAISRGSELSSILAPMIRRNGLTVHELQVSEHATSRPAAIRVQRRAMRLASYFEESNTLTFMFDSAAFCGTWLGGGAPVAPHLFTYLATALADYTRLHYAEQYGSHLGLMVSKPISEACPALGIAMEQFRAKEVTVSRAPVLKNLVVGLEADNGKLLGLGRITAIDFKRRSIGITTPVRAANAVNTILFGGVRIDDEGAQIGVVKPGEL